MRARCKVLIIGAGFGGLGMAHALLKNGERDFVVLEKGSDVGGVWRDNSYPGAACDVPSHLYSFSFAPNPRFSRKYAPRAEILTYLREVAERFSIKPHIRFNTEVVSADYDAATTSWIVRTAQGDAFDAQFVVSAVGQLSRPEIPTVEGANTFQGPAFHSALWPKDFDPNAKRVAVIGTGASAIQIVPGIIDRVSRLYLFQRSAPYIVPRNDRKHGAIEQALLSKIPALYQLSRGLTYASLELRVLAFHHREGLLSMVRKQYEKHLAEVISDPALRQKLTPDYPVGCKRVLLSDDYLPALTRAHAQVVVDGISHIEKDAIVTRDGKRYEVDAIVYATGFAATHFLAPMKITAEGRSLEQLWRDGAEAYLGVTVSGFPNLFLLYGPNTNLGHSSIVYMIESQIRYVMDALRVLEEKHARALDVRLEVQDAFNRNLQRQLRTMAWSDSCTNWYKTESGKSTNNWPGYSFAYRTLTRHVNLADYVLS